MLRKCKKEPYSNHNVDCRYSSGCPDSVERSVTQIFGTQNIHVLQVLPNYNRRVSVTHTQDKFSNEKLTRKFASKEMYNWDDCRRRRNGWD